jgi:hypothetical protein
MEGRQVLQARIGFFKESIVNVLDIVAAGIAEAHTAGLLALGVEIFK